MRRFLLTWHVQVLIIVVLVVGNIFFFFSWWLILRQFLFVSTLSIVFISITLKTIFAHLETSIQIAVIALLYSDVSNVTSCIIVFWFDFQHTTSLIIFRDLVILSMRFSIDSWIVFRFRIWSAFAVLVSLLTHQ